MKMKKHFIIIFLFLFSMQAYNFSIALTKSIDNNIEKLVDSDSLANQDIEYKLKLKKIVLLSHIKKDLLTDKIFIILGHGKNAITFNKHPVP